MRLKTIVALTDFSAQAEQCLDRAALLARVHQAELRILYGAEVPSPKFSDPYARLEQRGRQLARRHGITAVAVSGSGDLLADALAQTRDADLLVLDRRALLGLDWGLLVTFAAFFTFSGNMARIEPVRELFRKLLTHGAMPVAALTSQVISNVPAAILLGRFTDDYRGLLVGVNIGCAGTLVASLASLITFREYDI